MLCDQQPNGSKTLELPMPLLATVRVSEANMAFPWPVQDPLGHEAQSIGCIKLSPSLTSKSLGKGSKKNTGARHASLDRLVSAVAGKRGGAGSPPALLSKPGALKEGMLLLLPQ